MPAIKKTNSKKSTRLISGNHPRTRIDKNMPDYDKDPVFVKKNEKAAAFLKKNGLPKEVLEKINAEKKKQTSR
jgi:hypothetical protein